LRLSIGLWTRSREWSKRIQVIVIRGQGWIWIIAESSRWRKRDLDNNFADFYVETHLITLMLQLQSR
jgi:hypothetical protein